MANRLVPLCLALFIITVMFTSAGCNSSSNGKGATIPVTVTGYSGQVLSGANVVLGDSNGAMKQYGTTDSYGQITFAGAPPNATVTAAMSCLYSGGTDTTYSLDVKYDVNGPVSLRVDNCPPSTGSSTGSTDLGTLTLNVTNVISGITQNAVITNQQIYLGYQNLITRQTITITLFDLQSDGKLSIFVIGKDTNGSSIGYGYLLDQTFIDGMAVNITVDQPMSYLQYQISNMPATASSICSYINQERTGKGGVLLSDCRDLSSTPSSTTVNVPYILGLGDQFIYSVSVSRSQYNSNTDTYTSQLLTVGPSIPPLSNQSFDLNQALAAPHLTVSGTDTPTPTLSWNGVDPDAMMTVFSGFSLSSTSYVYLIFNNMTATRTAITFPELPDSLAVFRPTAVFYFSVDTWDAAGGVYRSSGETYLQY